MSNIKLLLLYSIEAISATGDVFIDAFFLMSMMKIMNQYTTDHLSNLAGPMMYRCYRQ